MVGAIRISAIPSPQNSPHFTRLRYCSNVSPQRQWIGSRAIVSPWSLMSARHRWHCILQWVIKLKHLMVLLHFKHTFGCLWSHRSRHNLKCDKMLKINKWLYRMYLVKCYAVWLWINWYEPKYLRLCSHLLSVSVTVSVKKPRASLISIPSVKLSEKANCVCVWLTARCQRGHIWHCIMLHSRPGCA